MASANQLHLPDLTIQGFRGIDDLSITRLGRVTLLAGRNGVGKTTVLDAVRVYVSHGDYSVLSDLLTAREEVYPAVDGDGREFLEPDWSALFHGRNVAEDARIGISADGEELSLDKGYVSVNDVTSVAGLPFDRIGDNRLRVLRVSFRDQQWTLPCFVEPDGSGFDRARGRILMNMRFHRFPFRSDPAPEIRCESLGPGPLTNAALGRFWDGVALTDNEDRPVEALRWVLGEDVDRVAVIGDDAPAGQPSNWRRAAVRLGGHDRPVPLNSLGDGAVRLFGVALALTNSQDGVLLVDEVENGIHHSVQHDYWRMLLRSAHENGVQVLATTHSWDCVRGFARAAAELDEVEGVLVRLDRDDYGMRAVEYSEASLKAAADQGIEVR